MDTYSGLPASTSTHDNLLWLSTEVTCRRPRSSSKPLYVRAEPATPPRPVVAPGQLSVTDPNPATPLSLSLRPIQAGLWLIACVVALSNVHEVRKSFRRARHRYAMVMWQFFKNKRKYFRKLRAELQLWKSLRKARHRYAMIVWDFYKTRRECYRKWHERRSRRSKKVRQSKSRGGMA